MRGKGLWCLATITGLVASGCTSKLDAPPISPSTTDASIPPHSISTAVTGSASCEDATGEGALFDLKSVELVGEGDTLLARFTTAEPPPSAGTMTYGLSVSSGSGDKSRMLGVKFLNGQQIDFFIIDFGSMKQESLNEQAQLSGKTLTVRFPHSAFSDLGTPWKWNAAVGGEGSNDDECPESGEELRNPKVLDFPG